MSRSRDGLGRINVGFHGSRSGCLLLLWGKQAVHLQKPPHLPCVGACQEGTVHHHLDAGGRATRLDAAPAQLFGTIATVVSQGPPSYLALTAGGRTSPVPRSSDNQTDSPGDPASRSEGLTHGRVTGSAGRVSQGSRGCQPVIPPAKPSPVLQMVHHNYTTRRESVRWLGRSTDTRSRMAVGRWYALALSEREARKVVSRKAGEGPPPETAERRDS